MVKVKIRAPPKKQKIFLPFFYHSGDNPPWDRSSILRIVLSKFDWVFLTQVDIVNHLILNQYGNIHMVFNSTVLIISYYLY